MSNLINAKIGDVITLNNKDYKLVESDVRSRFGLHDETMKIYELYFILIEVDAK